MKIYSIIPLLLLGCPGSMQTPVAERVTSAERNATAFAEIGIDNDGYVNCTLRRRGDGATVPIRCGYDKTVAPPIGQNTGCHEAFRVEVTVPGGL
tara:strand:- start:68 stop:352 length:285 start_codon:yes stop_codon:yes gene_type:complete